jgi:hypothetical protein
MPYLGNTPTEVPLSSADLQDGIITTAKIANGAVIGADINSTFDLTGKTVTLPAGVGGKVLQVVQATKVGTQTIAGSGGGNDPETFTDITDLSVSITPSSSSNKILILANVMGSSSNNSFLSVFRGSTNLATPTSPSGRTPAFAGDFINTPNTAFTRTYSIIYLDSPATTSSTTYKLGATIWESSPVLYINRAENDVNNGYQPRGVSTLIVMEIAG